VQPEPKPQQPRTTAERVAASRPPQQRPQQSQSRPRTPAQGTAQTRTQQAQARPQQTPPRTRQPGQTGQLSAEETQRRNAQRERREQEEKRTRMITIAVIACSVVAVIAIVIFLVMLLNGGLFGNTVTLKAVPDLIGMSYDELDRTKYPDFEITFGDYEYADEEPGTIIDQTPDADTQVAVGSEIKVYVSQGAQLEELPKMADLSGTTEEAATKWIDSLQGNLTVLPKTENHDTIPEGKVTRTEPANGEQLERGQTVVLYISSGPEIVKERVPNVVGLDINKAETTLMASGFKNFDREEEESLEDKGQVLRIAYRDVTTGQEQEIGNQEIDVNSTIVLYFSSGKMKAKVPDVTGKSYDSAVSALNAAGFNKISKEEEESTEEKGKVLRQSVSGGTELDTAQEIVLFVSKGYVSEEMPKVEGMMLEAAKAALEKAGFKNVTSKEVESSEPKGTVVFQSVREGTQYDLTAPIELQVSIGPKVTKKIIIELPMNTPDAYTLKIMLGGETIVEQTIQPGTPSITVDMVGRGVMDYTVFIEGVEYKTDKVDFDS